MILTNRQREIAENVATGAVTVAFFCAGAVTVATVFKFFENLIPDARIFVDVSFFFLSVCMLAASMRAVRQL